MSRQTHGAPATKRVRRISRGTAGILAWVDRPLRTPAANLRTGGYLALESKYFDLSQSGFIPISSTLAGCMFDPAAPLCINAPPIGDGPSSRDRDSIVVSSLQLKATIHSSNITAAALPAFNVRAMFAIVLDTQTNGAQCASDDIFELNSTNPLLTSIPLRDMQYSQRFQVLKMWEVDLTPVTLVYDSATVSYSWNSVSKALECFLPLNLRVHFKDGAPSSSIGAVMDNSLHVVAACGSAVGAIACAYQTRIRYQ